MLEDSPLLDRTVDSLLRGDAVGWFQGRLEFGPRALGARSILADPRNPEMQKTLNLRIKYRESFRPFAPSVLFEDVGDYFDLETPSPYMLMVADVKRTRRRQVKKAEERQFGIDKLNIVRSDIPAVTHVDYSARIQTVHAETNLVTIPFSQHSKPEPGVRSWSTPVSTCAGSLLCAPRKMLSIASWRPRWRRSLSETVCCGKIGRIRASRGTIRINLHRINRQGHYAA